MKKVIMGLLIVVLTIGLTACGQAPADTQENETEISNKQNESASPEAALDYPTETLNWTIAFGPGGGNDIMARTLIEILEKYDLYGHPIVPENREGGSGAVGWGFLNNQHGNPYHISTTSGSFITTPLLSEPGFNYEHFTHIALMATDDLLFLVPGDAPYATLADFVEAAQANNMKIGGIGAANVDRLVPATFAQEAGFDFEYVSFNGQGELVTAILSGSLDAIMGNPAEVVGQIDAGELKPLAFSGQQRLDQYPDVPTFTEEGYDVNISMPRGVIMPGGVSEEVRNWWIETMKKVAETPEWQAYIDDNMLTESILYGDDFTKYLEETNAVFEVMMRDLEIIE